MRTQTEEKLLQSMADTLISQNPALATALELFKVSNEQYKLALEPLQRPEFFVTNSVNDANVRCLAGQKSSKK